MLTLHVVPRQIHAAVDLTDAIIPSQDLPSLVVRVVQKNSGLEVCA